MYIKLKKKKKKAGRDVCRPDFFFLVGLLYLFESSLIGSKFLGRLGKSRLIYAIRMNLSVSPRATLKGRSQSVDGNKIAGDIFQNVGGRMCKVLTNSDVKRVSCCCRYLLQTCSLFKKRKMKNLPTAVPVTLSLA